MKNYIIAVLLVIILVLASLLYKECKTSVPKRFPVGEEAVKTKADVPLILYAFFTKRNCTDCLQVIQVLNDLPPHFVVLGIVPRNDLENEKELREISGAAFPLVSISNKSRRFVPWYTPAIIGVSPINGQVIFTIPGVPGEKKYLADFLQSLYEKLYPIFLEQKTGI